MADYTTSIEIAAPPEVVFEYLTTDAGMTAWMGEHAALDPRPGGAFAVDIAGYPIRGRYLDVEPPSRVRVSWGIVGSPGLPEGASTVEFRLTAVAQGTRLELTHSGLPDTEVPGHRDGWQHFVPRLAIAASGGDPGPDHWRPLADGTTRNHQEQP
ncbi:MAG: SRPBCC domain-containing protein [Micropruina sp.]|uniref:SRPBCC family protein n=1 Tax=Micropruina sp. TaxID=2737536 RepID=UPI0039E5EE49